MSHLHFLADEPTAGGVRRIAHAELDGALELLARPELDPNEAVHEARKHIKRLRALLRLVRKPLGPSFNRENTALRETAHALTELREAKAAVETIERLQQSHPGKASVEAFTRARGEFERHAPADGASVRELFGVASERLRAVSERLRSVELEGEREGFELLEPGFRTCYRRARQALHHASRHLTAEAFHQLRKTVKTHQHQLHLLEPIWPELIKPRRQALAELADLLGEHHDAALLLPELERRGFGDVAAAAAERSAELEVMILRQARKLFAERPRHLTGTLASWFDNFSVVPGVTRSSAQ